MVKGREEEEKLALQQDQLSRWGLGSYGKDRSNEKKLSFFC
jgi:hypothetical protein